ncbi:MAG: two-component regulator propeller domain-containing protein, partial [Cyclobacteriaceae bacterium]
NNWERFDEGNFSGPIRAVVPFNGKIYATGPTGVYRLGNGNWIQEAFLDTLAIQSLNHSTENLLMITDSTIWIMNLSGEISQLKDDLIKAPAVVQQDGAGNFWVGDRASGLVSDTGGTFTSYLPNGPSVAAVRRMVYDQGKLFVVSGGFSPSGEPLKNPPELNIFENGNWSTVLQGVPDLTDIAFHDNKIYLSSFGSGLLVTDGTGNSTILDETNSPLRHAEPGKSNIAALAPSADGLWVANFGGSQPLHLLKSDGSWDSFSFGFANEKNPTDIIIDGDGNVWTALHPASGGGLMVWERSSNQGYYKTDVAGSGNLPDKNIHSFTVDRDGYIWIGTDAGIAYFFSPEADAIKPVFENRFLLRDEKITALEVDGGNRKWIGTEEGVWLFNPTGEVLVRHFTSENSPLLSNIIRDIEIHTLTGEVFFATDKGIISYRGDAVTAGAEFTEVKIFPNPVIPGFSGTVGITGLSESASVKITDISGKLVWQTQANGGMATWHVRDHQGRRAATGIYLVFAIGEDGRESVVGKIAVVE